MLRDHKFFFNMIWLIILLTVPLPLIMTIGQGLPDVFSDNILGINLGIYAYSWMLSAIFLGTQPKWLDRIIGLPDMYIIHGVTAIFAVVLMYAHDLMLRSSGLISLTGQVAMYMFMVIIVYSLVFMAGWLTSRSAVLRKIKHTLEKVFKHELTMWIHRLNIVATVLVYIHIVLIDYTRSVTPFFVLVTLYTAITFIAYGNYVYKKYLSKNEGLLVDVRKVDDNVTELTIKIRKSILETLEAGDFAFISFPNIQGMTEPHPFSILNVPQKDGYVQMAIEGVGDFTKNLPSLKKGEKITITRGYGILNTIIEKSEKNEKFVLVGGGIGVVPLMGLADKYKNKDITFLYTVRANKSLLYLEKFDEWEKRESFISYKNKGRFTDEQLEEYLPIGEEYSYIIAGPMSMNMSYSELLKKKGIKSNKIYYEGFNF